MASSGSRPWLVFAAASTIVALVVGTSDTVNGSVSPPAERAAATGAWTAISEDSLALTHIPGLQRRGGQLHVVWTQDERRTSRCAPGH